MVIICKRFPVYGFCKKVNAVLDLQSYGDLKGIIVVVSHFLHVGGV